MVGTRPLTRQTKRRTLRARELAPLRIGPAGWSYRDWQGVVYPRTAPARFDALGWLARFFDLVEINVSFYRVPPASLAQSWVERTVDTSMHFAAKLPGEFTHGRTPVRPPALRPFLDFLAPLAEAGRLDVVLVQFPWSLRPTDEAVVRMDALRAALTPHAPVFEVRHAGWAADAWRLRLEEAGLDLVHVDQPALAGNLGPDFGPGRRAYVRLHGRNAAAWFDPRAGRDARYDWLYSLDDLRAWAERVQELRRRRVSVHVVTNNHFAGQAVVNALELAALLGRPAPEAPAGLFDRHPALAERAQALGWHPRLITGAGSEPEANTPPPPQQGELF